MRRRVSRALLVGGAIAAAVALGAGLAFAAGALTITGAGGTFSASGTITLGDPTSGLSIHCNSTMSGTLADVANASLPYTTTGANGAPHTVTSWSFTGCTSQFGSATLTVPAADLPDDFVFTSVSGPTAPQASGLLVTAGTGGALFHVSVLTCGFDVAGQPGVTWTNATSGQLRFPGTGPVHPANISAGCFGEVGTGDPLPLTETFTFTPATITIS